MANRNLHTAKRAKNDEFRTQLVGIEREMSAYLVVLRDGSGAVLRALLTGVLVWLAGGLLAVLTAAASPTLIDEGWALRPDLAIRFGPLALADVLAVRLLAWPAAAGLGTVGWLEHAAVGAVVAAGFGVGLLALRRERWPAAATAMLLVVVAVSALPVPDGR